MELRPATDDDRTWANGVYDQLGFVRSEPNDLLVVATEAFTPEGGTDVVAVARVAHVDDGTGELGGMYVAPKQRGQGIATALVKELQARSSHTTLYCIPYVHLVPLYEAVGFRPLEDGEAAPKHVLERVEWCKTAYIHQVTLLRWDRG